jgi:glycerol-3-phosphate dehydrogenase
VNRYFTRQIGPGDVTGSYSGVRPLFDDGHANASEVTRDYVLRLGTDAAPQILSAFGGKITTYRKLSEHALEQLAPFVPAMTAPWTADAPLPGGDLPGGDFAIFLATVRKRWPFLDAVTATRMAHAYGTRIDRVLGDATRLDDLGHGLSTREVDYLIDVEWATSAEDILWRRTKLGLHGGEALQRSVENYLATRRG